MKAAGTLVVCVCIVVAGCARKDLSPEPEPWPLAGDADIAAASPPPASHFDDLEPAAAAERPDGGTVTIKLLADARRQAHVYWGRKDLGVAPLEIVRPRGSAPLDLIVLAPGCLPLHTRAFTDRDDTLSLRLYSEREAAGLPGFSPSAAAPPAAAPALSPTVSKAPAAKKTQGKP
jgi:hypothetical protein